MVPKGSAVIILAWLGTISCSAAFGAGYTYTKVSYSKNGQVFKKSIISEKCSFRFLMISLQFLIKNGPVIEGSRSH